MSRRESNVSGSYPGIVLTQCSYCRHVTVDDRHRASCPAFGGEIPEAILMNEVDHRDPYPGDHGIRFEPREGLDDEFLSLLASTIARRAARASTSP